MPLPQNWNGIFWSKETNGDLLFDCIPAEFITVLEGIQEQGRPPFFIAGAFIDLVINHEDDRAQALLSEGKSRYPKESWDMLETFTNKLKEFRDESSLANNRGVCAVVSGFVSIEFDGKTFF